MRILLVSMGSIGERHYKNIKKLLPKSEIKILRTKNKKKNYIEEVSFSEAKSFDPNLVLINSPANKHFYYYKKFFKTARSFFIEKPLESKISNLDLNFLKKRNKFLMIGYVLRFDNILLTLKKLIKKRKYGKVKLVDIKVGQYLPDWRKNKNYKHGVSAQKKLGGGVLLELSHEIDYATWLFGFPKKIIGITKKLSSLKIDVEDVANIIMDYPDKTIQISLDFLQMVAKMEIKIVFDNATIYADLIDQKLKVYTKKYPKGKNIKFTKFKNGNEIYLRQFDFLFYKSFKNYKPKYNSTKKFDNFSDHKTATKVLDIVEKIKLSDKSGKKILLN